ncbi:MAG: response regulator [Rhodothermales bacterium]|nr:response regulator [Rhodothermales bacterium]
MSERRYTNRPDILLIEDNPDDVFFMREVFGKSSIPKTLHVVNDGEEALRYLRQQDPFEDAPRPSLIILDLKLPKMSGIDLLEQIKTNAQLRAIPVVVLTTSDADADATATYDLHATAFITKPKNLEDFAEVMQRIEAFWLNVVQLPPRY